MRLPSVLVTVLVSASASAQYFDDGWRPGQPPPAPTEPSFQPNPAHQAPEPEPTRSLPSLSDLTSLFSLETLLDSKPSRDLFNAFGINITDRIANASRSLAPWDDRVPLVTDDNFQSMIVDEDMPVDEESKRVWFLIVTVSSTGTNSISQFADKQFDEAFDTTLQADDLPHVRWGRIDYMNVTRITTKWGIWSAPVLVVLTDRGQTLRFYRATQIRLRPDALREFLRAELWQHTPPWSSAFAPGGKREFVMDWLAYALEKNYDVMRTVPRWLLYVLTGMIGSLVINLLHRSDPAKAAAATDKGSKRKKVTEASTSAPAPAPAPVETATATAIDASSSGSGSVKGRGSAPSTPSRGKKKGGKK